MLILCLVAGCRREAPQSEPPRRIGGSHVEILAWLNADADCQQGTIELLRDLERARPGQVQVTITDIGSREGREQWRHSGYDAMAIEIDGNTTVTWGEGDDRRTVSFVHPAGFAWTHQDLRTAVDAALRGELHSANPAEAEGVRLMDVSVRGQSIRVSDEGGETGQLIIGDRIVLQVGASLEDITPGQRVSAAAEALNTVLQKPFTPNELTLKSADDHTALMAGESELLVATPADTADLDMSTEELANRWRYALREALIEAALQRPATPELAPMEEQPEAPADTVANPLKPTE
jgi:hypothetical protein